MLDLMTSAVAAKVALLASEDATCAHDDCPVCGADGSLVFELEGDRAHIHGECMAEGCGAEIVE